jgi:hypothetical protein
MPARFCTRLMFANVLGVCLAVLVFVATAMAGRPAPGGHYFAFPGEAIEGPNEGFVAATAEPARFSMLQAPSSLKATARGVTLRASATRRATLAIGRRRYRMGRRVRRVAVHVKPAVGTLRLRLVLRSRGGSQVRRLTIYRPPTVWEAVLDQIEPGGRVPPRMALQAFSVAITPLPGVELPRGPVGKVGSGTGAISWLRANFDRITPAQRAAARRALDRLARGSGDAGAGRRHSLAELERMRDQAREAIEKRFGPLIVAKLDVKIKHRLYKQNAVTELLPTFDEAGTELLDCTIGVRSSTTRESGRFLMETMAHEVFHCYQAAAAGSAAAWNAYPPWLSEGSATWVGGEVTRELLGPGDLKFTHGSLTNYFTFPDKQLFERSYSAVGFFAQLAWMGIDPWIRLPAMLRAGAPDSPSTKHEASSAAFRAAAVGDERRFLGAWGASFFRAPDWGHDWTLGGVIVPAGGPKLTPLTLGVGGTASARVGELAASPLIVFGDAEVVTVVVRKGVVRTRDDAGHDELLDAMGDDEAALCVLPLEEVCGCPAGSARASPLAHPGQLLLALTGDLSSGAGTASRGEVSLRGDSVDEYCQSPALRSPACRLFDRSDAEPLFGGPLAIRYRDADVEQAPGFVVFTRDLAMSTCDYHFVTGPPITDPESGFSYGRFRDLTARLWQYPNRALRWNRAAFDRGMRDPGWRAVKLPGFDRAGVYTAPNGTVAKELWVLRRRTWLWLELSVGPLQQLPADTPRLLRRAAHLALPRLPTRAFR